MEIKKISSVFFSPTESTKKAALAVASHFSLQSTQSEEINITLPNKSGEKHFFESSDLVIFGVPVYGGRVPAPAIECMQSFAGKDTPALLIAVYGNRAYDDALLELKTTVEKNGFIAFSAMAIVAEHSIMHSVAAGRPDFDDCNKIEDFSKRALEKLQNAQSALEIGGLHVKGNTPYREYNGLPFKPSSKKSCTKCGICSQSCPVTAIPADAPDNTDKERCISCMRCMKLCPSHSRKINKLMLTMAEKAFIQKCGDRKEPELFI